jgi:diaminopimelate epimerase
MPLSVQQNSHSFAVPFYKANSIGNTIGIVPHCDQAPSINSDSARFLCSAQWGLACDQLMVLNPKIDIWNSDGTSAKACGNGIRCVIAILGQDNETLSLCGPVGPLEGYRNKDGTVSVLQGPVTVGHLKDHQDLPQEIYFEDLKFQGIPVDVGNHHIVVMGAPPLDLDPMWKPQHPFFPEGVNLSFVSRSDENFFVQTWERGVGRTLSCGSGACAVAALLSQKGLFQDVVTLHTPGGEISVHSTTKGWIHRANVNILSQGHCYLPRP